MNRRNTLAMLCLLCVAAVVLAIIVTGLRGGSDDSASSHSAGATRAIAPRTATTQQRSDAANRGPRGRTMPAQSKTQNFFVSPSGNIGCELDHDVVRGTPDRAYCQTASPARSVTMSRDGLIKTCSGHGCIGNGPEDAYTLPYGSSTELGRFRCASRTTGMTCTATAGAGFEISRDGVRKLRR